MNKNISVPQLGEDNCDASYTTAVDYDAAINAGAKKIGAVRVGKSYYYKADEVDEVFRLTPMELAQLGAGEIDERGSDYSLWCSTTGHLIRRPSTQVKAALGIE